MKAQSIVRRHPTTPEYCSLSSVECSTLLRPICGISGNVWNPTIRNPNSNLDGEFPKSIPQPCDTSFFVQRFARWSLVD